MYRTRWKHERNDHAPEFGMNASWHPEWSFDSMVSKGFHDCTLVSYERNWDDLGERTCFPTIMKSIRECNEGDVTSMHENPLETSFPSAAITTATQLKFLQTSRLAKKGSTSVVSVEQGEV